MCRTLHPPHTLLPKTCYGAITISYIGVVVRVVLVFPWGGMNSWFLCEFRVLSMGSISANIADNLLKIDYAVLIMVLGSGTTVTSS